MRLTSIEPALPRDANPSGSIHGGALMALADRIGSIAAVRHARHRAVTASVEAMRFPAAARVGDLLTTTAEVVSCGSSSMDVAVWIEAGSPDGGGPDRLVLEAHLVLVAVGDDGRPVPVPQLDGDDPLRRARAEAAACRRGGPRSGSLWPSR